MLMLDTRRAATFHDAIMARHTLRCLRHERRHAAATMAATFTPPLFSSRAVAATRRRLAFRCRLLPRRFRHCFALYYLFQLA